MINRYSRAVVCCLLCMCGSVQAQNVLFKIGAGVSGITKTSRPQTAMLAGVAYEHEFSQRWGMTPGIFLQQKGWKDPDVNVTYDYFKDEYTSPELDPDWNAETDSYRTGKMGSKNSLTYLTLALPFNHYLRTGMGNYVIFSAGPYASYCVSSKRFVEGDPTRLGGERMKYSEKGVGRKLDAGVQAQVAYQFNTGITLGLQGEYSFTEATKRLSGARNLCGMITLSYNFHQGNSYRQRLIDSLYQ